jgi:hypothetical protein
VAGKESELMVAGILCDNGLDVFLPLVDRGLDMVVQGKDGLYGIQVKSVKDYNRIVGLSTLPDFLIVHYRNTGTKKDELLYLTKDQVLKHWLPDSEWKDVVLNKEDRERYADQTIDRFIAELKGESTS